MKKVLVLLIFINSIAIFADDFKSERSPFQKTSTLITPINSNVDGSISLDFNNIAVRDILQLLARYADKNIVINNNVQGTMSLHLHNVSWQQALNTVVSIEELILREQDNIIFVSKKTADTFTLVPSSSELLKIRYAKAADLAAILKNSEGGLLSQDGSANADPRTNSLWIQDTPEKLLMIRNFIRQLDVPVKQVLIKARIVSIDESSVKELGVKFGTITSGALLSDGLNMDMPVASNQNGHFNIALARLGPNTLLDLELSALESEGHGKIISSPELITADRTAAYIEAGEEVPYQEKTSSGATNVSFKKAVLSLKVVPQITPENHIVLNLTVNQDKLSAITVNGVPAIQTREVQTQVAVQNNQTLVLGGIYEQTEGNTVERIPFLGSLPVVGGLFRNEVVKSERKELLIFVTPRVVE